MDRPDSGTYRRVDRVHAAPGAVVRLLIEGRARESNATLLELGMSDLLLSTSEPLALGTRLKVGISLPGRFLEFDIPGMVTWHLNGEFGISFDYLTGRQTYGLVMAIDLMSRAADEAALVARRG
jgi:hypothetical protein